MRRDWVMLPFQDRQNFLYNQLRRFWAVQMEADAKTMKYVLDGKDVCAAGYCHVLGISRAQHTRRLEKVKSIPLTAPIPVHGNKVG